MPSLKKIQDAINNVQAEITDAHRKEFPDKTKRLLNFLEELKTQIHEECLDATGENVFEQLSKK